MLNDILLRLPEKRKYKISCVLFRRETDAQTDPEPRFLFLPLVPAQRKLRFRHRRKRHTLRRHPSALAEASSYNGPGNSDDEACALALDHTAAM